jgi:hypothetical protein
VPRLGALHPERRLEAVAEILREWIMRHQRIADDRGHDDQRDDRDPDRKAGGADA